MKQTAPSPSAALPPVALVPCGPVSGNTLRAVAEAIETRLGLEVDVLDEVTLPAQCVSALRAQVHAGEALRFLQNLSNDHLRIVGVTREDLFLRIFTHVYGEAQLNGRAAVVSVHRLEEPGATGKRAQALFLQRSLKVALHELLHTFGLTHCPHTRCLMRAVTKLDTLDDLPLELCRSCRGLWEVERKEAGRLGG